MKLRGPSYRSMYERELTQCLARSPSTALSAATMQVRLLSLFDIVDARGSEMDQSETVTVFNDLCVLAPGALPFAQIEWKEIDARTVRGKFTNARQNGLSESATQRAVA